MYKRVEELYSNLEVRPRLPIQQRLRHSRTRENYENNHKENNSHQVVDNNGVKTKENESESENIVMKFENIKLSTADPRVWGPSFWFTLHNGALRYPENASPVTKERMKNFILGMTIMIPCIACKDHATAFIESKYSELDTIVKGRDNLFNFFVDFHNYVNKRYGKKLFSYKEALDLYNGTVTFRSMKYN